MPLFVAVIAVNVFGIYDMSQIPLVSQLIRTQNNNFVLTGNL